MLGDHLLPELLELSAAFGPPGREEAVAEIFRREMAGLAACRRDRLGSISAELPGDGPRIMLAAHLDEVGLMVKAVTAEGYLRFVPLGGWWSQVLLSGAVRIARSAGGRARRGVRRAGSGAAMVAGLIPHDPAAACALAEAVAWACRLPGLSGARLALARALECHWQPRERRAALSHALAEADRAGATCAAATSPPPNRAGPCRTRAVPPGPARWPATRSNRPRRGGIGRQAQTAGRTAHAEHAPAAADRAQRPASYPRDSPRCTTLPAGGAAARVLARATA